MIRFLTTKCSSNNNFSSIIYKINFKLSQKYHKDFQLTPSPRYITQRLEYFNKLKQQHERIILQSERVPITITLKDGKKVPGISFETTPQIFLKLLPRQLADSVLVAKVHYTTKQQSSLNSCISSTQPEQHCRFTYDQYQIIDLNRPLQGNCQLEFITFEDRIGKQIFWHSSSHLLGQAMQNIYGAWLCHGPHTDHGFFYDSFIGNSVISQGQYEKIEKQVKKIGKERQKFQRIVITKKQALELFEYNPFKLELIQSKIPEDGMTTAYRCGSLIDLCTGPHIPYSDKVRGFKITKNSSAYWHGDKNNDQLQRVYGVSYPKQSQLEQYIKHQEELAKKDHRSIGINQQLFNFSTLTPGSAFFLPHGATIYNKLINMMRSQYTIRGYQQVITPNIFHSELWKMSGHYYKYKEHIYFMKEAQAQQQHGLKPMNCPGHCLAFNFTQKSYKDLPIRMADFGVLHRNQLHGALSGLTRVRKFTQDDAHIFCRPDQILDQILGVLDLLNYIYSLFGFKYTLELSTRPEKYLGKLEDWDIAENQLKEALSQFKADYKLNQGDGAFYGPKIDVKLMDIYERQHQCGTIQLDFQLPIRFDLQYRTKQVSKTSQISKASDNVRELTEEEKYSRQRPLKQGFARPIIIHRAIFGSLQRFIAILCQQTGGKWDFWVSPRQIKLITINEECRSFAEKVYNTLLLKGYAVELDIKNDNLNKKIRKAQLQNFNYIGVIGKEEVESNSINIRKRDESKQLGVYTVPQLLSYFQSLATPKSQLRSRLQKRSFDLLV